MLDHIPDDDDGRRLERLIPGLNRNIFKGGLETALTDHSALLDHGNGRFGGQTPSPKFLREHPEIRAGVPQESTS